MTKDLFWGQTTTGKVCRDTGPYRTRSTLGRFTLTLNRSTLNPEGMLCRNFRLASGPCWGLRCKVPKHQSCQVVISHVPGTRPRERKWDTSVQLYLRGSGACRIEDRSSRNPVISPLPVASKTGICSNLQPSRATQRVLSIQAFQELRASMRQPPVATLLDAWVAAASTVICPGAVSLPSWRVIYTVYISSQGINIRSLTPHDIQQCENPEQCTTSMSARNLGDSNRQQQAQSTVTF